MHQLINSYSKADNQAATTATDALINYESVKHFNADKFELSRYDMCLEAYEKSATSATTSLAFLNIGQNIILTSSMTCLMVLASQQVLNGALSIGDVVMLNGLVFQLAMPLGFLGMVYRETRQSLIDMEVMFELQNVKSLVPNPINGKVFNVGGGVEVEFDDISFGYPNGKMILKGLNFKLEKGKSYAFVGASGCGKSTLLKLLYRFHDPIGGTIRVNGSDLKTLELDSFRKNVGVVPQDTVLFNGESSYFVCLCLIDLILDQIQSNLISGTVILKLVKIKSLKQRNLQCLTKYVMILQRDMKRK